MPYVPYFSSIIYLLIFLGIESNVKLHLIISLFINVYIFALCFAGIKSHVKPYV